MIRTPYPELTRTLDLAEIAAWNQANEKGCLMARIRTIKPDAFASHSLSLVPREVRWTFAGLWTYCDDEGRARDDIRLIKAALYPLDDDVTLDILEDDLAYLVKVGCVCRYTVGGRQYLHVPAWDHQKINRPSPSKLPACPKLLTDHSLSPHGDANSDSISRSEGVSPDSVSPHGALTEPSLGERKGKEQGRERTTRDARVSETFPDFWAVYPRRVDRGHAQKAFATAVKNGADPQVLIDAARLFAEKVRGSDPKFIAYAATWLRGERWMDEDVELADSGWLEPWVPPAAPAEIADDPERYAAWLDEQRELAGR